MKTTFRPRLLNGQTGDPALLLTLRWQGRALLVDCGRIGPTPASVLLPIEAVFVSHAHMDHFMGFDQLLRLFLARDTSLRFFGPEGLADCVAGQARRLHLEPDRRVPLHDRRDGDRRARAARAGASRPAAASRASRSASRAPFDGVVLADAVFRVEAAPLDHKIVSMAYAVTERTHLNVRPDALDAAGLRPGPLAERAEGRGPRRAARRHADRGRARRPPAARRAPRRSCSPSRRARRSPTSSTRSSRRRTSRPSSRLARRRGPLLLRGAVPRGGRRSGDQALPPDGAAGRARWRAPPA